MQGSFSKSRDGCGQSRRVAGSNEKTGFFVQHDFGQGAVAEGDDRFAHGHGLDVDQAERLG